MADHRIDDGVTQFQITETDADTMPGQVETASEPSTVPEEQWLDTGGRFDDPSSQMLRPSHQLENDPR